MSLEACAGIVQRGDPDRFRAVMAAPVWARARLFPLYAFNIEIARAPYVTREPLIAEMRLQWWRDALAEIVAGGPVRRHEVATPLAAVLAGMPGSGGPGLAVPALDAAVAARRADIDPQGLATEPALAGYLDATGGNLMRVAAMLLGAGPAECDSAQRLGRDGALAAYLCAVPQLVALGRASPYADKQSAGASGGQPAGPSAGAAAAGRARAGWRLDGLSGAGRLAALAAWQAPAILARAMRDPAAIAAGRLRPGPVAASLGLMRAAWPLSGLPAPD